MKKTFILAVLCLVSSGPAAARAETVLRLTLKEAVNSALEQNHLIKSAAHSATAAGHGVAIAASRYYPGIFFEESFAASNAPTQTFMMKLDEGRFSQNDFLISNLNHPSSHHDFKTALTLQQPLYIPSTAPAVEMAGKDAEIGALGLEEARHNIAFTVFRSYLEAQNAAARQATAEKAMAEAREHLRLARVRTEAGVGLKSDELRARTHLAAMESQLINAGNTLLLAQMRLALVTGSTTGNRVEPAEPFAGFSGTAKAQELLSTAQEFRTDLRRSRTEVEKSDAAVRLARSSFLPSLGAFASYQVNAENAPFGSDNDAWAAGISLKWQIFDGFLRSNERDRAAAVRSAATETLEHSVREVSYQVQESLLRREEASQRLEVARLSLQDAEETVRLISRRFENSLATMAELLDAQNALNQARSGVVESEAVHALADGQVYYTAGIFLKEISK